MRNVKELNREVNLISLTNDNDLVGNLSNIIQHKYNNVIRRKKLLGLPLGSKYTTVVHSIDMKYYDCIKLLSEKYNVVITGSVVLKIFDLLNRDIDNDIDIIANQKTIDELADVYEEYKLSYGDVSDLNYIKSFVINGIKVDVFLDIGQKYKKVVDVKVHEPFEIINMKLKLNRTKDNIDVSSFIKLFENNKL